MVQRLDQLLRQQGVRPSVEPIIPTGTSFIKPDLIVEAVNQLWIMDVSVVASYRMQETWDIKVSKYGQPDRVAAIRRWAAVSPSVSVHHLPIIISNWGLLYEPSGAGLGTLALSRRGIVDLCVITITDSLKCYDVYMRGTGKG